MPRRSNACVWVCVRSVSVASVCSDSRRRPVSPKIMEYRLNASRGRSLYRSQPSHFSSCLTTLTLETPQFALLDAAQGALSVVEWPQLYWCTTLVHMLARTGEQGALHSGGRLVRAALRIVGEEGGRGVEGAGGRADWPGSRELFRDASRTLRHARGTN